MRHLKDVMQCIPGGHVFCEEPGVVVHRIRNAGQSEITNLKNKKKKTLLKCRYA